MALLTKGYSGLLARIVAVFLVVSVLFSGWTLQALADSRIWVCPVCGSHNVSYGDWPDWTGNYSETTGGCYDCMSYWDENGSLIHANGSGPNLGNIVTMSKGNIAAFLAQYDFGSEHEFKYSILGNGAPISKWNIVFDKKSGWVYLQNNKSVLVDTHYRFIR